MLTEALEIVPAILSPSFETMARHWAAVIDEVDHVQLDVTDGIFAGAGTFRDIARFAELGDLAKMELHLMVQPPADYVNAVMLLKPARCAFHLEAFESIEALTFVYQKLREVSGIELGLALNPATPYTRIEPVLNLIDYVLFLGVYPGQFGQSLAPEVPKKISAFHAMHPHFPIAVDGHVGRDTIEIFVQSGARILCIHSAIFGSGVPKENIIQLRLLAEAALIS